MATCLMSRSFNFLRLICSNNVTPSLVSPRKVTDNICNNLKLCQRICAKSTFELESSEEQQKKKHKTVRIPQITLLLPDKSMTITTLENAAKIAKRRNLELNKVADIDNKSNRATYELSNVSKYAEDKKQDIAESVHKQKLKGRKLFIVHSKITEHDVEIKIKNINKLLSKGERIKIILTRDKSSWESVFQSLKSRLNGQIAQSTKGGKVVLQIDPLTVESKVPSAESKTETVEKVESEAL